MNFHVSCDDVTITMSLTSPVVSFAVLCADSSHLGRPCASAGGPLMDPKHQKAKQMPHFIGVASPNQGQQTVCDVCNRQFRR